MIQNGFRYCYLCGHRWPFRRGDNTCPACNEKQVSCVEWVPMPSYIEEECERIRRGWTAKQRRQRYRGKQRWHLPTCKVPDELRGVV